MADINKSNIDRQVHPDLLHHKAADRAVLIGMAQNEQVDHSEKVQAQRAISRPARKRRRRR